MFHRPWLFQGVLLAAVSVQTCVHAEVQDWRGYNRDLSSQRYTPLAQIDPGNARNLRQICSYDTGDLNDFESGLLEVDGALLGTTYNDTFSIDANTCKQNWRSHDAIPFSLAQIAVTVNRGLAYQDGRVFRALFDGRVAAYDVKTGKQLWVTRVSDASAGEYITAAPIAWSGLVFIGNSGGDVKGVKGHMFALDAKDGHIVWESFLVPRQPGDIVRGPLAPDSNATAQAASWGNAPGYPITGGATWTSYTLDPDTGLLYIPGANPSPQVVPEVRPGDDLYVNSLLVLDAKTGAYQRHFQLLSYDFHDWDVSSAPMLITSRKGRSLLIDTPKDGYLYAIDLASKQRLYKMPMTTIYNVDAPISAQAPGTRYCPGHVGGSEWNGPSYHPGLNLIFSGQVDWCTTSQRQDDLAVFLSPWGLPWRGVANGGISLTGMPFGVPDPIDQRGGHMNATDADTGKLIWSYRTPAPIVSGTTTTAGGLLLFGDIDGAFYVFDAAQGKPLWSTRLDGALSGGVISYDTGQGQRIAVSSGKLPVALEWQTPIVTGRVTVYGL